MRSRGALVLCLLCSVLAPATPTFALSASTTSTERPGGPSCNDRSWIGGTTEWCRGNLVYRDYVYDDTGADTTSIPSVHGTPLNRATGDVDHRDHSQALNSADLLAFRMWRSGKTLRLSYTLNTLFDKDETVAALVIDTDDNTKTGGGRWGSMPVTSAGWDTGYVFRQRDAQTNTITASVPLPTTEAGTWRVQTLIALGDGTPMNVAFRPKDGGDWWEDDQADALAAGDVSEFGYRLETNDLLSGRTHRPSHVSRPGLYERVYTSKFPIAEGVDYTGRLGSRGETYQYLGSHQPYGLYVPTPTRGSSYGVQFALHGRSAAHASLVGASGMQHAFGDYLRSLGDKPRLVVVPLGRGAESQYIDHAERDVLDVLTDVKQHYPIDSSRIFAGGYSMGGQGTYWLTTLRPDIWAGAISWVGHTVDCLNGTPLASGRQRPEPPAPGLWTNGPGTGCDGGAGNVFDYLDSTRHVPMGMLYAGEDELVWSTQALALRQRYADLGYEHAWWFHPAAEHLTLAILDDWQKEATWSANRTLVRNPARVTYRTNTYFSSDKTGLKHDSAYWVRDLRPAKRSRDRLDDISVDLVSHRCGPDSTADTAYDAGSGPVPWIAQLGKPRPVDVEPGDRISGTVTNASSFMIDVSRACMTRRPIDLDIDVDGPTVVRFSDGRGSVTLEP